MQSSWKKVRSILGAPAGDLRLSLFAMDRIKVPNFNQKSSRLNGLRQFTFAVVNKPMTVRFATDRIIFSRKLEKAECADGLFLWR